MKGNMANLLELSANEEETKKIITTSSAFGLLRKGIIENLGTTRAKSFLLRYGWSLGVTDAEEAMKQTSNINELLQQASILHLSTGHIKDIQSERIIEMSDSNTIKSILGKGKWIDSFEANEHLKHHGESDIPACHTLTGYASGYMSTVCKKSVIVKEICCIAKGDAECCFEARLQDDWGIEISEELKFYKEINIIEELEYTYEQLLEQRKLVEKVSRFHKKLTESISNGNNLQDIADTTFKLLKIPISVEDLSFQKIVFSGINQEEYSRLSKELKESLIRKNRKNNTALPLFNETTRLKTENQERLLSPIIVQKKVIGYCTFLYPKGFDNSTENNVMFIERVANAASLYLLNEKTSFEAVEKMKGYFLEQILKGQYSNREEVIHRGRYMGINLAEPFYVAALDFKNKGNIANIKKDQYEQILETIAKYLDIQGYKALIAQYEGQIIMLIPESAQLLSHLGKIIKHVEATHTIYDCKMGISDKSDDIEGILENLEESLIALRMAAGRKIIHFKDLGIVGVLINSKNVSGIKKIAKQELGPLFKLGEAKQKELVKTLYVFLSNGGKLQQTMDDLALSMSGLMYRINKIESLLQKDLRDSSQSYQLQLILDSQLALGELEI
ncbi:PucR family transcriptional regulator [Bacillus sp. AFS076308]|uniref:XylR N-terminal domain-containing protein n=1 Tax=Bacillus sp. AFS076308 TaxID=2033512 RepID=UPI000BF82804|nr:V4R domain-containing protein [Bacillus sp. AFS076308]PFO05827.1 PucR family transcriptional regulator [Bacillus sp. AFS076308]